MRVVEFWRMLELLSPQKLPALEDQSETVRVTDWSPGEVLPWEALKPHRGRSGRLLHWHHTVYLGTYEIKDTYDILWRAFGEDEEVYDERPPGLSACAGILISPEGLLVPGSAILSSALWTVGRLKTSQRCEFDDFEATNVRFREWMDKEVEARRSPTGQKPVITDKALHLFLEAAHRTTGILSDERLARRSVRIHSVARSTQQVESPSESDFLNSFFLNDLTHVRELLRNGDTGRALQEYLTPKDQLPTADRIDIVRRTEIVDESISITKLPLGRWPSPPSHPLARSQQFAVNSALNDLAKKTGIMAVNGPPGTGKTTMLRDLLAGNIVERARRLSHLTAPADAFLAENEWPEWVSGDYRRRLPPLISDLTGFEMVVASANNGAVENITTELPGRAAIDERWRSGADYFAALASAVLAESREGHHDHEQPQQAWGMVSARLGRLKHRRNFRSSFWFSKEESAANDESRRDNSGEDSGKRMLAQLKSWRDAPFSHRSWPEAKERFRRAEAKVDRILSDRLLCEQRISRTAVLKERLAGAEKAAQDARNQVEILKRTLSEQHKAMNDARIHVDHATADHQRHMAVKPGALEILFTLGGAVRRWREELTPLSQELQTATRILSLAEESCRDTHAALKHQEEVMRSSARTHAALTAEVEQLQQTIMTDAERLGNAHPSRITDEQREYRAPWLDPELDTARSELFLAAMELHKDFIANSAGTFLEGMTAAIDVVGGAAPADLNPESTRAAWQLFFLVVPLVSTTFASATRMMKGIGKEGIGWLLIDEGGQAAPQHAVGAMWHAKRVIVVGDPLQLEPVTTTPSKVKAYLAQAYDVDDEWIPPLASVQTLADRISPRGTWLRRSDTPVWVGSPLRVHRRCDEPMFSLCNRIAYNGLMVSGVSRGGTGNNDPFSIDESGQTRIRPSSWFNIRAAQQGTHLQREQVNRFLEEVEELRRSGIPPDDIIAISPFKVVASHLRSLASSGRRRGMQAGTIHTAQGREAPVVFLVLGGDPDKEGARAWAASSVNLVNVAVSRAQRRLYVIGDRKGWERHPYFADLAASLPVVNDGPRSTPSQA